MFANLHVHSYYSLLDGFSSPERLVDRSLELGQPAIAITEHGNMFNCLNALKYAREKGQKLIIGCESYICDDLSVKHRDETKPRFNRTYHIVLLAKNTIGYRNLCKLISIAYRDGFYGYPRIDHKVLMDYSEGLICLTACVKGEIPSYALDVAILEAHPELCVVPEDLWGAQNRLEEKILWYKNIFGDDLYLELMPGDLLENTIKNLKMVEISARHNIKLIATNDVHYDLKENAYWHDVLLACNTNTTVHDPNRLRYGDYIKDDVPRFNTGQQYIWKLADKSVSKAYRNSNTDAYDPTIGDGHTYTFKLSDTYYLVSEEDMLSHTEIVGIEEAINNTMDIVNKFEDYNIDFKPTSKMPSYQQYRTTEDPMDQIEQICKDNWERKLSHVPVMQIPEYADRFEYEKGVIKKMGFGDYFLILWDIVSWAKKQGIYVGPGRGSAGGSLIVYLLDITDVDPIEWALYFERFLNPDRISMPDIDMDFEQSRRGDVVNYIIDRFGSDKVSQIITFAKLKAKSVIQQAGAVLGVPFGDRQRITGSIDTLVEANTTVADLYEADPQLYDRIREYPGCGQLWVDLIEKLEMIPKSAGQHAAGVIISPEPIYEDVPVFYSKGEPAAMFDMNLLEDFGYVKFDILGVKTLDHIRITVEFIEKNRGLKIDPWNVPLDDKKALKLYTSGALTGVFQCKYPGFRKLAQKLDPATFMHVVDLMCLYRPGPLKEGMTEDYINRRHGKNPESKFHPDVQKILEPTYGIMLYQEQIMEVSRKIFGWTFSKADELRKAIGKKKLSLMNKIKDEVLADADAGKTPYPKDIVEHTFMLIEPSARYSWNKAHGVEYGLISYVTAYLKAHYPVEFYGALLCTEVGNSDELMSILTDVRHEGINLVPPNINKAVMSFSIDGDSILYGFSSIRGIGDAAASAILEDRIANGPYNSFVDFCNRVPPVVCNKSVKKALVHAGAFDFDRYNRQTLVEAIDPINKLIKTKTKTVGGQKIKYNEKAPENLEEIKIVKMVVSPTDPSKKIKQESTFEPFEEYPEGTLLRLEKEVLGAQISGHVLDKYVFVKPLVKDQMFHTIMDALKLPADWVTWVLCTVTKSRKHIDKRQNEMAFITLSDQLSSIDCICFASDWGNLKSRFAINTPMMARITINHRDNQVNGIISDIFRLDAAIPIRYLEFREPCSMMDRLSISAMFGQDPSISADRSFLFRDAKALTMENLKQLSEMGNKPEVFR